VTKDLIKISKFLSYVLRHKPEAAGLELDAEGWGDVELLIAAAKSNGYALDLKILRQVVAENDKKRFVFSSDLKRIRANQGHSVDVALNLPPSLPPEVLWHGTAQRFLESIMEQGLRKMNRHHVHLTENAVQAKQVGARYGKPVLLRIDARRMTTDGVVFYKTENNVWLVDTVRPEYISIV